MHHHDIGKANDARDRLHLAHEIEIELVIERGVDGVGRRDQKQRVAVRCRAQHLLGRNIGAAARPVLDDERLPELFRKPLPHQARREIRRAAGGVTDHQPHRPRWIGLRIGDARCGRECSRTGDELQELTTLKLLHASSNETRAGGSLRPRSGARILKHDWGVCVLVFLGRRNLILRADRPLIRRAPGTVSLCLAEIGLMGEPDAILQRSRRTPVSLASRLTSSYLLASEDRLR